MTARTVLAWVVAAVLGLALAAGITLAASQLSSQRIGLSGEPLSAGDELVPRALASPGPREPARDHRSAARTTPPPHAAPGRPGHTVAGARESERDEAPDGDD